MIRALTIFDRSPAAKRKTAQELLAVGEARLRNLEQARGTALADADSIEEALGLDREIAQQRATNQTYRERITALVGVQQRVDTEQRERERTEAIDKVVVPAVAEIERLAAKFQTDLLGLMDLYEKIHKKRDRLIADWPPAAPTPRFASLHLAALGPKLFGFAHGDPRGSGERLISSVRYHGKQIADGMAKNVAEFLDAARRTKIETDDDQEAVA